MTDKNTPENVEEQAPQEVVETSLNPAEELVLLKERARQMGIPFSGNIGIDSLRKRIENKLTGNADDGVSDADAEEAAGATLEGDKAAAVVRKKSRAEREQEVRDTLKKEQLALVRCRIYNLNPSKRDLEGEIVTVSNKFLGTQRKFIPYGEATENGYHIPRCIYNDLKNRKYQQIRTKKVKGQIVVDNRVIPEFNLEILEPLSEGELKELATKQAAAERLGAE